MQNIGHSNSSVVELESIIVETNVKKLVTEDLANNPDNLVRCG